MNMQPNIADGVSHESQVPTDVDAWIMSLPKQQLGETFIQMKYRKLLAIQARLSDVPSDSYTDWADARDAAEHEIAVNIAETLEDVVIKLTCLTKNMRVHGDLGYSGPMLDLMLADSALTGVREALANEHPVDGIGRQVDQAADPEGKDNPA